MKSYSSSNFKTPDRSMPFKYRLLRIRCLLSAFLIPISQIQPVVFADDVLVVQQPEVIQQQFIPGPLLGEIIESNPLSKEEPQSTTTENNTIDQ
jgi:hypothetical protein